MTDPTPTNKPEPENIAATLARVLPKAEVVYPYVPSTGDLVQIAIPKGFDLREIDTERMMPYPREARSTAQFSDAASYLAYVKRHAGESTAAWCIFDPQTFALQFIAVIDDHSMTSAGWRKHRAQFTPDMSAEWKAWKGAHTKAMTQTVFAEFLQEHEDDITSDSASMPTSLQMHAMAADFVANEERMLKSSVRLQSGGVRLTYVADPDKETTESMQMFEKFGIGIPVFHGGSAWAMTARLKYRAPSGKLSFWYELIRPDRTHAGAAKELIDQIRTGLGDVPMFMGNCT